MANWLRVNLASAIFPFYTEAAGRTIIVPQNDENWDRYNAANTTQDKGVPQVFYMHNVAPIAGGFQAIGYISTLAGLLNHTDFDRIYTLYNSDGNNFLFSPSQGKNYIYDGNVGYWASISPFADGTFSATTLVTTAYVNGQSYIFYQGIGCYKYDDTNHVLTPVTPTGLTVANVIGICAANGYMIAWTSSAVAWSSLTDPTNFVPNIQTGAGGGPVQDAKGSINFCLEIPGGFLIYCAQNIVGASFTGNTSFPYTILECVGSGGVDVVDKVAYQGNLSYHVAMTSAGIQQVTLTSAAPTMPEVSDFLTAQIYEDFDEVALTFSTQYLGSQLATRFQTVADRFVIISYGPSSSNFTHAIIYDFALNRYGKLKINHRDFFTYISPAPFGFVTYNELLNTPINSLTDTITYSNFFTNLDITQSPKQNIAVMQSDGTVLLVDFELSEANADGVFIIGKYQMQRGNVIVHQYTDVETVLAANTFNMYLLPTFDGKDFGAAIPTIQNDINPLMRTCAKRFTAKNISLCCIGAFNLNSMVINYTIGGFR